MPEIIFPQEVIKNVYCPDRLLYTYYEDGIYKSLYCLTVKRYGCSIVDQALSYKLKNNLFMCDVKFLITFGNSVFNPNTEINIDCVLGAEFKL